MLQPRAEDAQVVFPVAWVKLDWCGLSILWVVDSCPICGRRHTHGAGAGQVDPRRVLGHRAGHCRIAQQGYVLVDAYPQRTAQLAAELGLQ